MESHRPGSGPHALAVVMPAFDEVEVLPETCRRLRATCDGLGQPYEVVIVDDGSSDGTGELLATIALDWPELHPLLLSANVGHQRALTAGLAAVHADAVVTIDADLQDPPELIPDLIAALHRGYEIAYAQREDRSSDTWFKRWTASRYYGVMRRFTGVQLTPHVADYRALSGRVVDLLRELPEKDRIYRMLLPALGFRATTVGYTREPRFAGRSHYPFLSMLRLAVDSALGFTTKPLRAAMCFALCAALACFGLMGWALTDKVLGHTVSGWTSVTVAVLGLGAVQLFCIGIIGEYLAKLVGRLDGRPAYLVAPEQVARPVVHEQRQPVS